MLVLAINLTQAGTDSKRSSVVWESPDLKLFGPRKDCLHFAFFGPRFSGVAVPNWNRYGQVCLHLLCVGVGSPVQLLMLLCHRF
jgi:hypothetical protein